MEGGCKQIMIFLIEDVVMGRSYSKVLLSEVN